MPAWYRNAHSVLLWSNPEISYTCCVRSKAYGLCPWLLQMALWILAAMQYG